MPTENLPAEGKWLSVIKTPMIFNAFSIVSIAGIVSVQIAFNPNGSFMSWFGIAWIVGLTVWVNWKASRDPRSLMYGPKEYLEESRMGHERDMKRLEQH